MQVSSNVKSQGETEMKDEILLQRLHRVAIAFAVSERILSPRKKEKGKKKSICLTYTITC